MREAARVLRPRMHGSLFLSAKRNGGSVGAARATVNAASNLGLPHLKLGHY
jgi:hypothetical protein